MIQLPNGCSHGEIKVTPANWRQVTANTKSSWFFKYRFYDPAQREKWPEGLQRMIRGGVNKYKDVASRRKAMEASIEAELQGLAEGFNPIHVALERLGEGFIPASHGNQVSNNKGEILPTTPFITALKTALARIPITEPTRLDYQSVLKYVEAAAIKLNYNNYSISNIKKKHIKRLLEEQENLPLVDKEGNQTERKFSADRFNRYLKCLHRLIREVMEEEACEYNTAADIEPKITVTKMREVMPVEQRREMINVYLKQNFYSFYRFCQIFFHSGARIEELLRIQVKDINLERQRYKMIIKKGKKPQQVERTIKNIALPFWVELIEGAGIDDYIFSRGLVPGKNKIRRDKITRRWRTHAKQKFGITADIYSLKHSNLDETAAIKSVDSSTEKGIKVAQKQAGHTTPVITMNYLHGQRERDHNELKEINNEL